MSALSPRRIQPRFDVNGWLFVGPALALIATFMVFPVLHSLWMSFQTGLGMRLSFAGLKNYINVWQNGAFKIAVKNTFTFTGLPVSTFTLSIPITALRTFLRPTCRRSGCR